SAHAEDGLVVHFTIKETEGSRTTTYSNGVLMRLTEASTMVFSDQYELSLESQHIGGEDVNLVVTLKDLSSGKPTYAGSGAETVTIGKSATIRLHELPQATIRYEVFLDTSYGQLPAL